MSRFFAYIPCYPTTCPQALQGTLMNSQQLFLFRKMRAVNEIINGTALSQFPHSLNHSIVKGGGFSHGGDASET